MILTIRHKFLTHQFHHFVKLLWIIHQLAEDYQKCQLYEKGQSKWFLGRLLGPLLKTGSPLIKSLLKPLFKSFIISFWVRVAGLAIDAVIQRELFGSIWQLLIILNEKNGLYHQNN